MKKRILFIIPRFEIGGTMTALRNLLERIDCSAYDVSIFVMAPSGPLRDAFVAYSIVPEEPLLTAAITNYKEETRLLSKLLATCVKIAIRIAGTFGRNITDSIYRRSARSITRQRFDTVIAFQEGAVTRFASFVEAPNKIAWIHCNYAAYLDAVRTSTEHGIYAGFDRIVCVSRYTRDVFCGLLPEYASKTLAIHNILNDVVMFRKSEKPANDARFSTDVFTILSLGRLDPIKQFDRIPGIAARLREKTRRPFRWYVIGAGTAENTEALNQIICREGVQHEVVILGAKLNPYPYIRQADLVVVTSLSEACPYVVNEAKILKKPVLCTDFGSASEFIEHAVTGFITPIDNLADEIAQILNDGTDYRTIGQNLENFRYDNERILSQIYDIL